MGEVEDGGRGSLASKVKLDAGRDYAIVLSGKDTGVSPIGTCPGPPPPSLSPTTFLDTWVTL